MSRLTHAVIAPAALDVRRRPDHAAELTSQLLLGETVRVLGASPDGQWRRVECLTDGYRGWVREWGLLRVPAARARSWREKSTARVTAPIVEARTGPGTGTVVSPLFLNSVVIPGRRRGEHRRVELPDGRRGWVPAAALASRGERPPLHERVLSLMGVPYHWGGRTPGGFDCSGFVQQVLAEQGVALPRDVARQLTACAKLRDGDGPLPGDLIFFASVAGSARHVGVGLGGGYFAHCRGMVRVASTESHNRLYDKALMSCCRGWFRPREGPRRHPGHG